MSKTNQEDLSQLVNELRIKAKELEEIAYQYESRNQIMIDNLSRIKDTLDDKTNNLKVERQLKTEMIQALDKNILEELHSPLPDKLMAVCEDVELLDLKCSESLGEDINPVRFKEREMIEEERKNQHDINHNVNVKEYLEPDELKKKGPTQIIYDNVNQINDPDLSTDKSSLAEFGKALGAKISSAFNSRNKTKKKPLSAEDVVKTVLSAVNEETSNGYDTEDFSRLTDKDVYINGEKPNEFFEKINSSKVEALKKALLIENDSTINQQLSELSSEVQLQQLSQLHQVLKLKYIMYLQHLRPGQRLGKETQFLKDRGVSKSFQELSDVENVPTFEEYLKNCQKDPIELELGEESNQDMLDRLFGDLDEMNSDLSVQIIRSMLLSSMLKSPDIEENFYKKRIHDLEALVKYVEKYENPVSNDKVGLEPAVISPEITMSKVLEADIPDFILFKDLQEEGILQEMIKYYFQSESRERVNSFLAEMQEIERTNPIEPDVDHQFKNLDESFFQVQYMPVT